jgi:hypothetical protein
MITDYAGQFVPTTNVWDVQDIYSTDVNSDAFKELLVRLYQNLNNIAIDTGLYNIINPFVNGQVFFPNPALTSLSTTTPSFRQVLRLVINFGALPGTGIIGGTKSVLHGLPANGSYTFTRIYACASDTSGLNYIPIPYSSPTLASNIELSVDSTHVTITTGSNRSNFNVCYVVLEWMTQ